MMRGEQRARRGPARGRRCSPLMTPLGATSWRRAPASQRMGAPSPRAVARRHRRCKPRTPSAIGFWREVRTVGKRDLPDRAAIAALPDFSALMPAASFSLGQLLNPTELARDAAFPKPIVHRRLDVSAISQRSCGCLMRPSTVSSIRSRGPSATSAPPPLALPPAGAAEPGGALLGTLHSSGLLPSRNANKKGAAIHDGRTAIGEEVDVVIGTGSELAPTEVKAARSRGLRMRPHRAPSARRRAARNEPL